MFKIIKTKMWNSYMIKFVIRLIIFGGIAALYIIDKPLMYKLMTQSVWKGISPIHVLWLIFMVMMICHIFPTKRLSMALRKVEKEKYSEVTYTQHFIINSTAPTAHTLGYLETSPRHIL